MKKKYKLILIGAIVIATVLSYGAVLMAPAGAEAETVVKSELVHSFSVQGEMVPETSMVVNSPVSGRVIAVPGKPGLELTAGGVLAQTDGTPDVSVTIQKEQITQQLSAARQAYDRLFGAGGSAASELAAAKSQYELANKAYVNGKTLSDQGGYISQTDLDGLKTQRDVAYESLRQAEENNSDTSRMYYKEQASSLEKQLAALSDTVSPGSVVMPYDGVIWEMYVQNGSFVAQNTPVAKVYQEGAMKISASVLAEDAAYLKEGQDAEVVYPDGTKGTGAVSFLSKVSTKQISSIGMEENRSVAELAPSQVPLRTGAGQSVDLSFHVVVESQVITVPAAAVLPYKDGSAVYAIRGKKAVAVPVETGRKESGRVEIISGINEGDVIAADPYNDKLKDGSRVKAVFAE